MKSTSKLGRDGSFWGLVMVAPAAVAMVWKWIFNAEYGILNQALGTNIR